MDVNGRKCKIVRDTGGTYDDAHSCHASLSDFTGGYVCVRQALIEMIKLPVAKVIVSGSFDKRQTLAAASESVLRR